MTELAHFDRAFVPELLISLDHKAATCPAETVATSHTVEDGITVLHSIFLDVHVVGLELAAAVGGLARER